MTYATEKIEVDGTTTLSGSTIIAAKRSRSERLLPAAIKQVVCTVETANIRFCCDDSSPADGHLVYIGDVFYLGAEDAERFKAIKAGANAGLLVVSYEV